MAERRGRPRASSREVLAEAACELFLERGYEATSIADITTRAGVARSSFFNYFASKGDVVWGSLDERITGLEIRLAAGAGAEIDVDLRDAVVHLAAGFAPDPLALALGHADAMGAIDELERDAGVRRGRIAAAVARRLRRGGVDALRAEVIGAAYGGAVLAAIGHWAAGGAGRTALDEKVRTALDAVPTAAAPGTVRQLRVVVRAAQFDDAVRFYRDVVGMGERAAFDSDGGARVVILDAGAATLELSNPAQVALIDRVETDGDAPSEPIRLAFEVADCEATTERMATGGAKITATARPTPWGSVNSRLDAPAGLQVTVFQENAAAAAPEERAALP